MPESHTISHPTLRHEQCAPGDLDAHMEAALADAFPPLDAPQDALQHLADTPPANELLAAIPPRNFIRLEELIRAFSRPPIIILRQPGIALATLVAIGGALFLHMLLGGLFLLAIFYGFGVNRAGNGKSNYFTESSEGGSGYMVEGEGAAGPPALEGTVKNLLAHVNEVPQPDLPKLPPELPIDNTPQALMPTITEPDIIGLAANSSLTGELKPRAARPAPRSLVVAPPRNIASAAGSTGHKAQSPKGGAGTGGGEDDEPVIGLFKEGRGGGNGEGRGAKTGRGIDRGESGANNPHPQILDWTKPNMGDSVERNPPSRNIIYEVTVLADGTPDTKSIRLVQSCGRPDLDEIWKSTLLKAKFLPAYAAGKPYAASDTYTYEFVPREKEESKN